MRIILFVFVLLSFSSTYCQDSSKVKLIDKRKFEIDSLIRTSTTIAIVKVSKPTPGGAVRIVEEYFIDASKDQLLKVKSNEGAAPNQNLSYYFEGKLIKAELLQHSDNEIVFVVHHYFNKTKQIYEKVESEFDIAFVSWQPRTLLHRATRYLRRYKDVSSFLK